MKLTIIVDALQAAGIAPDVVLIVLRAVEAAASDEAREARESGAARREYKRQWMIQKRAKSTAVWTAVDTVDSPQSTRREKPNKINGHVDNSTADPVCALSSVSKKEALEDRKEKKERPKASRLPSNWEPERAWLDEAVAAGLSEQQATMEACKFRDWSLSSPNGKKLDWHATWRNWFRRRVEELPKNKPAYVDDAAERVKQAFAKLERKIAHGQPI